MRDTQDIRRFMILGSARTGSNFLLSLLSAHPSVKTYGELFNLDSLPQHALQEAMTDPAAYLRRRVYASHPSHIAAVGFKMFYYHLTRDYFEKLINPADATAEMQNKFARLYAYIDSNYDWSELDRRFHDAWTLLAEDPELMVIHLTRRNMLNTLISHKTAFQTNRWMRVKGRGPQQTTILNLDAGECRRYFEKLEAFAQQADALFGTHKKIDVCYEELVADRRAQLEKIFAFLDISVESVSTIMAKQIVVPASEVVANYSQLKESFSQTRWSRFFEE
jgi:LPS sulfotransferase NodH